MGSVMFYVYLDIIVMFLGSMWATTWATEETAA
jgi:hypothetical protein